MQRMTIATHINPEALHSSPAFSWAVRVPAGADTIYVGGQNGVGPDGTVVGPGMAEQARQALTNLRTTLEAAGAEVTDIVKWTILYWRAPTYRLGSPPSTGSCPPTPPP